LAAIDADEPPVTPLHARRRRSAAMPRAAVVATASVLVLGLGGAAAAVSGGGWEPLRRAVSSVASDTGEAKDPAQRATAFLAAAEEALDAGDLTLAADQLSRAQNLLPQVTDAKAARTLRAKMAAFQARWQRIVAPVTGALKDGQERKSSPMLPMLTDPKRPGATPQASDPSIPSPAAGEDPEAQLVPEAGMDDPSHKVPLPDPRLDSAKDDLADTREKLRDRAKERLDKDKLDKEKWDKERLKPVPEKPQPEMPQGPMPGDLPGPSSPGPLGGFDPGWRSLFG
jgi:hypothetical protein